MKCKSSVTRSVGSLERVVGLVSSGLLHDRIAKDIQKLVKNEVECDHCGRKQPVNIAECLRTGWPKCCGETMNLNSLTKPNTQAQPRAGHP